MLCEIAVILLLFFMPFILYKTFKLGYEMGKGKEIPVILPKKRKTSKETDEVRKLNIKIANLEAYDGTSFGQREVK